MTLRWLDFDYSEDIDGNGVFDAMASVELKDVAEVESEIAEVTAWAETTFAGRRGAVEEGGDWDCHVEVVDEQGLRHRQCFTLTIGGTEAFCDAFREKFAPDF